MRRLVESKNKSDRTKPNMSSICGPREGHPTMDTKIDRREEASRIVKLSKQKMFSLLVHVREARVAENHRTKSAGSPRLPGREAPRTFPAAPQEARASGNLSSYNTFQAFPLRNIFSSRHNTVLVKTKKKTTFTYSSLPKSSLQALLTR